MSGVVYQRLGVNCKVGPGRDGVGADHPHAQRNAGSARVGGRGDRVRSSTWPRQLEAGGCVRVRDLEENGPALQLQRVRLVDGSHHRRRVR
eukprot:290690-Rhodomonas_salina.1